MRTAYGGPALPRPGLGVCNLTPLRRAPQPPGRPRPPLTRRRAPAKTTPRPSSAAPPFLRRANA
eukprot:6313270-Lingulodinium_polyedra.AAC.1